MCDKVYKLMEYYKTGFGSRNERVAVYKDKDKAEQEMRRLDKENMGKRYYVVEVDVL